MKSLSLIFLIPFFTGCVSLNTLSLTSIPAQRSNIVKADVSKVIFLGFNFDNDFVDQLEGQLKNKCPNGVVSGILTKDEVVDYFLLIVWKHQISATGYCVKGGIASRSKDSRHPTADESESDSVLTGAKE